MSSEHRDEIYVRLESIRLEQERNGYVTTNLFAEARALFKALWSLVVEMGAHA